jgi:hypothetical protein
MCSRAIRVWVCAYRVLLAAVDEVELDKRQTFEMRKNDSRSECGKCAALRFAGASAAAQSSRAVPNNTITTRQHDIAEEKRQGPHQAFGSGILCLEGIVADTGGVLPWSWVRHIVPHTCRPKCHSAQEP